MPKDYCGCCGGELESQTQVWCSRCSDHVLKDHAFWAATWYAQYGKYCPFTDCQFVPHSKAELRKRGLLARKGK